MMELTENAREKYKELVIENQKDLLEKEQSRCEPEHASAQLSATGFEEPAGLTSFHQRSSSFPSQIVTSLSCGAITTKESANVSSYQPEIISSNAESHVENSFVQTSAECRVISSEESPRMVSTKKIGSSDDAIESPVVAHQEITFNISISDAPLDNTARQPEHSSFDLE